MLTPGLLAAVLLSAANAAGPSLQPVYAVHLRSTAGWDLLRLDPETLAETGRASFSVDSDWVPRAASPEGSRVALGSGRRLIVLNPRYMRQVGGVTTPLSILALAWPSQRITLTAGTAIGPGGVSLPYPAFARIDPRAARVTKKWELAPHGRGLRGTSRVVEIINLVAPSGLVAALTAVVDVDEFTRRYSGGPLVLSALGERGPLRTARVARIRLALENWHVTASSRLPPLARKAVELAREDFQRRTGYGAGELVAMRPSSSFLGRARYDLVFRTRGYMIYRAWLDDRRTTVVIDEPQVVSTPPEPTDNDLLRAANGTWEVADAALVVGSARRAFLITSGGVFAEVDLKRARIRYRALRRPIGGRLEGPPALVGRRYVLFVRRASGANSAEPLVLDTRKARLSPAACDGRRIEPVGSRAFCYGYYPRPGLTVLDASGRRLYTILDESKVVRAQAQGPFGYVRLASPYGGEGDIVAFDIETGRPLRTVPSDNVTSLLLGRNPTGWTTLP